MERSPDSIDWTPERQIHYPLICDTAISPDGSQLIAAVRLPLLKDDASAEINQLYMSDIAGGGSRQISFGESNNRCPRWSPDGQYLAFISNRSGRDNIHLMRADGGEARPVTSYEHSDVQLLAWAPGGAEIVFLMVEPPSQAKLAAVKAKDDPILFDLEHDWVHLFRLALDLGSAQQAEAVQLTAGAFHVQAFDWYPDGSSIALIHRPRPVEDDWPLSRLASIPVNRGSSKPVEREGLKDHGLIAEYQVSVKLSPNGKWIACATGDQPARWAFSNRIFIYPTSGGVPRPLSPTPDQISVLVGWSQDSQHVYALDATGTATTVWELPASGEAGRPLLDTGTLKGAASLSMNGQLAFVEQDFHEPNYVSVFDLGEGQAGRTLDAPLPPDWPASQLPAAEVIRWDSRDGLEIEGVLIYPAGYKAGETYPLVVHVHGGPTGVFTRQYLATSDGFCDAAGLAERGFFVLRANPRGSGGYGRAFRFANMGDWGGGDYQDIMAGVDQLIEQGMVDPDRMGIMGWSYGGFMTSWVITQTDRFKAACVGAGVTNLMSFDGTSDIPSFVPDYFGGDAWEALEPYRAHSALFQISGASTPTLILHGAADVRVPLSQGRELYNALKRQGVETEMVIYPRQGHAFNEPRLKVDVRKRATAWLERWFLQD
jgi:dipeptidyl aminopeptidase/acylaminoacyl peptidase